MDHLRDGRRALAGLFRIAALAGVLAGLPAGAARAAGYPGEPPAAVQPPAGQAMEEALRAALQSRFGTVERWEFNVTGTPEERAAGRLPAVEVTGYNWRLPRGMVIAELALSIQDAQLDLEAGGLKSAGTARVRLRIRPEDLSRAIEARAGKQLKSVRISVDEERIQTRGKLRVAFLTLGFHRSSRPLIKENAVYAHTFRVTLAGMKIPTRMIRKLEAKINPLIDFNEFQVPITLEKLGAEEGWLVFQASLDLTAPLREIIPKRDDRRSGKK
jgi:hypothetical protein